MELTRVDTAKLTTNVSKASTRIQEALALLRPFLVALTDKERSVTPRVRDTFPTAARQLAHAVKGHPKVVALAEFDPEAVIEDLNNVDALAMLVHQVDELSQLLNDSRLAWGGEALQQSLAVYSIAKLRAKTEADLQPVVDSFAPIFASTRSRKPAAPAGEKAAEAK